MRNKPLRNFLSPKGQSDSAFLGTPFGTPDRALHESTEINSRILEARLLRHLVANYCSMTTFQGILYAIIHGFTEFLPVGPGAHQTLLGTLTDWAAPGDAIQGALALGAFLALLVYFRHDWASVISSGLQVILFRKKPMTLDERMPFFLLLSSVPGAVAYHWLKPMIPPALNGPIWIWGTFLATTVGLWFAESMSRKNRGMFDWNVLDALAVGLGQCFALLPGVGRAAGALMFALLRNYNREAAAKFTLFAAAPMCLGSAILHLREISFSASEPTYDTSWMTFGVIVGVTFAASLISVSSLMKVMPRSGLRNAWIYRIVLAAIAPFAIWAKVRFLG